jgi:uncharacterized protein (TIGR02453 family)
MDGMAAHLSPKAITFLRGLAKHNDRDWFEARRDVYETELKRPMLAAIDEISEAMETFAPEHVRPAHKILMRIYRDIRFSGDKRPYKIHMAAWWARRGMRKTSGAGFYLDVHPDRVMIAAGVYMPEREQLLALRRWMADHHEEYRAMVAKLLKPRGKAPAMEPVDSASLKRMPKGFAAEHPADDLLRATNWGVHAVLPGETALASDFVKQVVVRFARCASLVAMLNEALVAGAEESGRSLRPRL